MHYLDSYHWQEALEEFKENKGDGNETLIRTASPAVSFYRAVEVSLIQSSTIGPSRNEFDPPCRTKELENA